MEVGVINGNVAYIPVEADVLPRLLEVRQHPAEAWSDLLQRLLLGFKPEAPGNRDKPKEAEERAKGMWTDGLFFPLGTLMHATASGKQVYGVVRRHAIWVNGKPYWSVSSALKAVVGYEINGWRYWECMRPDENEWVSIDRLRREAHRS